MCIKIELICIAIFVTRKSDNTVIHLNQWNTPFWSPALSRDHFVRRLCQCVRLSVCLVTFVIVKLWNIKTTCKGNIISSIVRPSTILNFYARPESSAGASSNRIVCRSVHLSVRLSVRNSVPLTNKVRYLKFGWWYSNHTLNVSSYMGSSHFTNITSPWGLGQDQNVGITDFAIFNFVAAGGIHVSQTHA